MSKIIVRKLESPTGNLSFQGGLTISDTTSISYPGRIFQMKHKMIHTRTSWSNPGSDTGSVSNNVPNMNMDFQCKFSDSLVILEARVMGDVHHNTIFRYTVNGNKITTAAYDSYNDDEGANRWSGLTCAAYDGADNNSSTPGDTFIMVYYKPGNTNNNTYRIVARNGNTGANTNYINRCGSSNGQNSYECGVSSIIMYEIEE